MQNRELTPDHSYAFLPINRLAHNSQLLKAEEMMIK
jgi:hypothetical protein